MGRHHYHPPVAPLRILVGAVALGATTAALAVNHYGAATGVVVAYLVFGGLVDGQGPSWGMFSMTSALLLLCATERLMRLDETMATGFLGAAVLAAVAAALLRMPPYGQGGPIGPAAEPVASNERQPDETPADHHGAR